MPILTLINSQGNPLKHWNFHEFPQLSFGRGDEADARIADEKMSQKHFLIAAGSDGYQIQDLDSSNGTWVNGKTVTKQPLRPGDKIQAGGTRFVWEQSLMSVLLKICQEPDP